MAGKKEKKAKKDDKKTSFLPKVIDGIKLPKDARRQLTSLARHPVIADLLASGLVALAQRIKGDGGKPEAAPPQPAPPPAPAPEAAPALVAETTPAPTKAAVKRIRKPATAAVPTEAKPARVRKAAATPAEKAAPSSDADPAPTKAAKAPPPRRTRKKAPDAAAKPRTRRTPPKTDG